MYLSAFLATSILIYMVSSPRRPDSTSPHNKQFVNTGYVVVLAVIAIFIGFIPYLLTGENLNGIINTILSSRAADKPWAHESSLGNTDSALFYLTSSGMIGGAVILWTAALLDFRLRHNQRLALGLIAFVTTLVVFFEQGTRSLFFLIVVPPLALVFLRLWNRSRLQITLLALIALFFLLAAAQFQRLYRSEYTRDEINLDQVLTDIATLGGNVDFFKETAYSVALVPEYHDYFYESALMMFAVSPIPRFFWPEKPAPQLVRYYTFTRWGIDNQVVVGNMQPGIVGQHYLSWGWPGPIFAGLIVGWLARRIDNLLMRFQTDISMYFSVVCLMTVCWLFLTFRLLSPGFFYPVILCILIVMITRANTSDKYAPASDV